MVHDTAFHLHVRAGFEGKYIGSATCESLSEVMGDITLKIVYGAKGNKICTLLSHRNGESYLGEFERAR
jgi:hypothetical protein